MLGVIWNCRGINKKGMTTCVKEFLLSRKADFVGLQETMKKYTDKVFRQIDPGKDFEWQWIPSVGKSGGVLCGVRIERFEVRKFVVRVFSLTAQVRNKKINKELTIATMYGPAHEDKEKRLSLLSSLRSAPLKINPC
jgi:exonuclease III